jgi:hypothetical protein
MEVYLFASIHFALNRGCHAVSTVFVIHEFIPPLSLLLPDFIKIWCEAFVDKVWHQFFLE